MTRALRKIAPTGLLAGLLAGSLWACGDKAPAGEEAAPEKAAEAVEGAPEKAPEKAPEAAPPPKLDFPATAEGAKALLGRFVAEGADTEALSRALRPTAEDYRALFVADAAGQAEKAYAPAWDAGQIVVRPKAGQTEVLLFEATTDQIKVGDPAAESFPGGYKDVAASFAPGVTLYRFKFVAPGETTGMAFDGLAHVNGRWVIVPKPWRALR